MSNAFNARIFGRRRRGDREDVRIKLFNLDGTPFEPGDSSAQGGSAAIYQGASTIAITADPGQTHDFVVPFANSRLDFVSGFDFTAEDETVDALAGAYFVKTKVWFDFPSTPDVGALKVYLTYNQQDPDTGDLNAEALSTYIGLGGFFDFSWADLPGMEKMSVAVLTDARQFKLHVRQEELEVTGTVSILVHIVQL